MGLGECEADWCDRPAVAYASGPTLGRSPRLLLVAGERAAQLAAASTERGTYGVRRCADCLVALVDQLVGHAPAGAVPL
jgi:hypothetical protein